MGREEKDLTKRQKIDDLCVSESEWDRIGLFNRDVTRGPYEPYVRHRHTAPAYRTGCQLESWHPYPVSGRLFTVYSHTLTSVYGRHMDHSSEHTGALVVTRLPSFLARSPSSISATCHYLSIFVHRLFLSHFPHFFFL